MMTDGSRSTDPPPGWYAESPHSIRLRWWNGTAWTNHFRDPAVSMTDAPTALASTATQPLQTDEPLTRAQQKAARDRAALADQASVDLGPKVQPAVETPTVEPAPTPYIPDMILDRSTRTPIDRIPSPVVYSAPAGARPPTQRATFMPVPAANGPAIVSLVLAAVAVVVACLDYFWISATSAITPGLLNVVAVGLILAAVVFAIAGAVVSAQRPTRKTVPMVALVAATALAMGGAALVLTGTVPLALVS